MSDDRSDRDVLAHLLHDMRFEQDNAHIADQIIAAGFRRAPQPVTGGDLEAATSIVAAHGHDLFAQLRPMRLDTATQRRDECLALAQRLRAAIGQVEGSKS